MRPPPCSVLSKGVSLFNSNGGFHKRKTSNSLFGRFMVFVRKYVFQEEPTEPEVLISMGECQCRVVEPAPALPSPCTRPFTSSCLRNARRAVITCWRRTSPLNVNRKPLFYLHRAL